MKKVTALLLTLLFVTGCSGKREELDRAMTLRAELLACDNCSFEAEVTADYGDALHQFAMTCQADSAGQVSFTVTAPESIAGITGKMESGEGHLTFDEAALAFPLLAEEQISPVSGPWILMKTLLGGYLTACVQEEELLRLTVNDSYEEDALVLEIWLDGENSPVAAEILYDGRRIVTMEVKNFQIM